MKILKYTLIELLAAMTIFIIMIGILFKTFVSGADVAATESIKMGILSDANVFFNYLTEDLSNINVESIQRLRDKNNAAQDPDQSNAATNEAAGNKLHFDTGKISFYSNVKPYDDTNAATYNGVNLVDELDIPTKDGIPDDNPYVAYELVGTSIVRKMYALQDDYVDDNNVYSGASSASDLDNATLALPVILEGVESFTFSVWSDYPGGTLIDSNQSPLSEKPACITFTVTLIDPNPYKATALKDKDKRSISKTIFLDR